jgi:hypothetical protein
LTPLAKWAASGGLAAIAVGVICLAAPTLARKLIERFPRSKIPAWSLAFADMFWVTIIVAGLSLGPKYDPYKPLVYLLAPVIYIMIITLMNELLAPRALGFLLLLLPAPILDSARWHSSDLRLVVTVLCYVAVVIGIVWVLNPYMFRKMMSFWTRSDSNCRILGGISATLAAVLIVLATMAY